MHGNYDTCRLPGAPALPADRLWLDGAVGSGGFRSGPNAQPWGDGTSRAY